MAGEKLATNVAPKLVGAMPQLHVTDIAMAISDGLQPFGLSLSERHRTVLAAALDRPADNGDEVFSRDSRLGS